MRASDVPENLHERGHLCAMLSGEFSTSHLLTAQYAQSWKRIGEANAEPGAEVPRFRRILLADLSSGGSQSIIPTLSGAWGDSPFRPPCLAAPNRPPPTHSNKHKILKAEQMTHIALYPPEAGWFAPQTFGASAEE